MLSGISFGQTFKKSKSQDRVFEYINVIALLETKGEFQNSKSKENFVTLVSKGVDDANYVRIMTPYLNSVYQMHVDKFTQDNAYDNANLTLLYDTYNKVADLAKNDKGFNATIHSQAKFNWGNLWRKIVNAILDSFEPDAPTAP